MPVSKQRRRPRSSTRRPSKTAEARARATQTAQREAAQKKVSPSAYARRRFVGWTLVGLGVLVGLQHLVHHMGAFTLISPGWDDIVAGYPLAGVLGVAGAIVLSK